MNFQFITSLVQQIINAIQNSAVSSVKTLAKNNFSVTVKNQVKKVDVKGQVVVSNLKNLDKPLKALREATIAVKQSVDGIPTEITVKNFPETVTVSNQPSDKNMVKSIEMVDKSVQSLHKPLEALRKVEITNQPVGQIESVRLEAGKIVKAVKALKLDPKITVQAPKPERIIVPPAQVSVEKTEIDYKKIAKAIADSVPNIDYTKLEALLQNSVGSIQVGGGGSRSYSYQTSDGTKTQALVDSDKHVQVDVLTAPPVSVDTSGLATSANQETIISDLDGVALVLQEIFSQVEQYYYHDKDATETYEYVGFVTQSGSWRIFRNELATETMRYATGTSDYETNWTNHTSLTYDYIYA